MNVSQGDAYFLLNDECCFGGQFDQSPAYLSDGDVITLLNLNEGPVTVEVSSADEYLYVGTGSCVPGCSFETTISIGAQACHTPISFYQATEASDYGCPVYLDLIWEEVDNFSFDYNTNIYYPCYRKAQFIHNDGVNIPGWGDTLTIENAIDTTVVLLPSGNYTVLWENGSCSGTEQLFVGPPCTLNASLQSIPGTIELNCFDGLIEVTATTNACYGFWARLLTLDSTLLGTSGGVTGDTLDLYVPEPGIYLVHVESNPSGCSFWQTVTVNCTGQPIGNAAVSVRAFLEGPYSSVTGLMTDSLRAQNILPTTEPYTALGYTHGAFGGGETVDPGVFDVVGNNAIVDWVVLELRDPVFPQNKVYTRCALLQRDGDVVDMDGISPIVFNADAGDYYVAIRHRNHLGCMTSTPIALSSVLTPIDLTQASTTTYGTNARADLSGVMALWTGDASFNGEVRYTGNGNDRDLILTKIGGVVPTTTTQGYDNTDVNLDGRSQYTGSGNDRDRVLLTIGGVVPTSTRTEQLP